MSSSSAPASALPCALAVVLAASGCPRDVESPPAEADPASSPASPASQDPTLTPVPDKTIGPARSTAQIRAEGNHLRDEPSPYLQQHAHNPVDWYPWGEEALARARTEGKPIFLSVGYSTCHWCHVMEEESFEDDEVAEFLNTHFISIKVDREQRPDIDAIYITAVGAMGRSTGWPLTVFLTPKLQPFFGGTYFPPKAQGKRPGFMDVLREMQRLWSEQGEALAERGQQVLEAVEQETLEAVAERSALRAEVVGEALGQLDPARDREFGGYGRGQKFPQSPLLLADLRHVQRSGAPQSREHLVFTLEQMMRAGIHDHLAGTFHRYAVDKRWHLPHFEKTLYDNAQLAAVYLEAGQAFGRDDFTAVGRGVLDDLVAHWQRPDGGLVVGWDADDPQGEGHFYSWTVEELRAVLPAEDASIVARAFGVESPGLRQLEGRSMLHRQADAAEALRLEPAAVQAAIDRSLPRMATARAERPPPGVDGKELVAWNGLAIMALADAARWLDEPRYRAAAERAAAWVMDTAWSGSRLSRGVIDGQPLGDGFLDDHALAGLGLVRLHAATGDLRWLVGARRLADEIVAHFFDQERHAFVHVRDETGDDPAGLPLRIADFGDQALPSGGAAAILLLLEVAAISGDRTLDSIARDVLEHAIGGALERPYASGTVLVALDHATAPVREVVVAGDDDDPTTAALWRQLAPTRSCAVLPVRLPAAGADATLIASFPALEGKRARRSRATAYVCEWGRCEAPTSDPKVLAEQVRRASERATAPG